MERNSKLTALILHVKQIGENNRLVTFLCSEKGVFNAVLFGGPKSKLKSLVQPYHLGTLWIYTDKAKNSVKITDFEPVKYHTEIRENVYKTWCASFLAELIIKTEASGENEKTFKLANAFLDGICASSQDECKIALLRFIWRYLSIMGLQTDCKECFCCSEGLDSDAYFSVSENGFLCPECAPSDNRQDFFYLSQESVAFLQSVTYLSPKESRNFPLHYSSSSQLHDFLFFLIDKACEHKLKTLEMEQIFR